jgi:hypothetical protein
MSVKKSGARVVKPKRGSTRGRVKEVAMIFMVEFFQRRRVLLAKSTTSSMHPSKGLDHVREGLAISSVGEGGIANALFTIASIRTGAI